VEQRLRAAPEQRGQRGAAACAGAAFALILARRLARGVRSG
jgi:hypothetical protein